MSGGVPSNNVLGSVCVAPARLRKAYWLIVGGLCGYGAWVWMGTSGIGLFLLWLVVHQPWRTPAFLVNPEDMDSRGGVLTPWHISLLCGGQRLDVFKDEVSGAHWARLRRCLHERPGQT